MPYIIDLKSYSDKRGSLTVIEKVLPFDPKRIYYIYDVTEKRGGHRHKISTQALICLAGSCEVYVNDNKKEQVFKLDNLNKCLILNPEDWHTMDHFSENAILLVLSSSHYDVNDYIDEEYE